VSHHEEKKCLVCDRGPGQAPLITFEFKDVTYRICPQHFPFLIHSPHRLKGKLPGAEALEGADHHD
jgi:hypothetical protein